MSITRDVRLGAKLLAARTAVRAFALAGDPAARALGRFAMPDPYPMYRRIRERGDLIRHPLGVYVTAAHAVSRTVLRDGRFEAAPAARSLGVDWIVRPGDEDRLVHPTEDSLLVMNPPRHTALRQVIAPWFTPHELRGRRDRIHELIAARVDGLIRRDDFELIGDFALRVPMSVVCDLFGIPDDDRRFAEWGATMSGTLDGLRTLAERRRVNRVLNDMTVFFNDLVARRRAAPGDDLVSRLLAASVDRAPLAGRDVVALAGMLLIGGFETVANAIGGGAVHLLREPHQRDLLPAHATGVVEEILRLETPAQFAIRFTSAPTRLAGTTMPAGAPVVLFLAGANRDPRVFSDPDRMDAMRPNNRDHLAFSAGIHYCLGAALARMEIELALRELFDRMPGLALAGPVRMRRTRNIRGPVRVPVRVARGRTAGVARRVVTG